MACSDSSGFGDFGDESPVFNNKVKELAFGQNSHKNKITLQDLHKRLLEILKDKAHVNKIPKKQLKSYLATVEKANPTDPKSRWTLMKIRGLLNYMLKKRMEFHNSLASGEITIYEKSLSQTTMNSSEISYDDGSINVPSEYLTNDNFVSVSNNQMECKSSNYSEDIFGETVESLHSFSQENYQILKSLTDANKGNDDGVFKVPSSVEKVRKMHESTEQDYNLLVSQVVEPEEDIFENLPTNDELKAVFADELEVVESWVTEVIHDLGHLELEGSLTASMETQQVNTSTKSTDSTTIKPYYNEENFRIIREVSIQIKEYLKKDLEISKQLQNLQI